MPGKFSIGIGNTNTTGNNTSGIPLIDMLRGAHNKAYYKDKRVIEFLYPQNQNNKSQEMESIINYQKTVWVNIGPSFNTIKLNDKGNKK